MTRSVVSCLRQCAFDVLFGIRYGLVLRDNLYACRMPKSCTDSVHAIPLARRRHGMSTEDMAARLFAAGSTLWRLVMSAPSVALRTLANKALLFVSRSPRRPGLTNQCQPVPQPRRGESSPPGPMETIISIEAHPHWEGAHHSRGDRSVHQRERCCGPLCARYSMPPPRHRKQGRWSKLFRCAMFARVQF